MEILHTETKSNRFLAIPIHSLATNIEPILYKLLYRLNLTFVDKNLNNHEISRTVMQTVKQTTRESQIVAYWFSIL